MRSEKGAITLVTLVTVVFILAFLLSSFVIISNRLQTQAEIKRETGRVYAEGIENIEEVYQSFFANELETVPITNAEQLLSIGTGRQIAVDGKIYKYSADKNYILKNDIEINEEEYGNEYENQFNTNQRKMRLAVAKNTEDYPYNGSYYTFTALEEGTYLLEVWGAQGGDGGPGNAGGFGGYTKGKIKLLAGDNIYIYVGGQGEGSQSTSVTTKQNAGGYNGGGNSYQTGTARGAGGGATDIRFSPNEDPLNVESLLSRVIVAGGGGGNLYNAGMAYASGNGGGLEGGNGSVGYGGTQNGAGIGYEGYAEAGFGYGGYRTSTSTSTTCGGGGGWYGGGSGNSAGGGSGFVWTIRNQDDVPEGYSVEKIYQLTETEMYSGKEEFTAPDGSKETGHSGDGYARVTLIKEQEGIQSVNTWLGVNELKQKNLLTGEFIGGDFEIKVITNIGQEIKYNKSNDFSN